MDDEIMNKEELHAYGVDLIVSYLQKEGYTIVETNKELNIDPQIIAQKSSNMIFIIVRTVMYPKKEKDIALTNSQLKIVKDGATAYHADCYVAKVGLACTKGRNPKELSIPYKNGEFLVKFKGLKKF